MRTKNNDFFKILPRLQNMVTGDIASEYLIQLEDQYLSDPSFRKDVDEWIRMEEHGDGINFMAFKNDDGDVEIIGENGRVRLFDTWDEYETWVGDYDDRENRLRKSFSF